LLLVAVRPKIVCGLVKVNAGGGEIVESGQE
jgi:hypothetical protein